MLLLPYLFATWLLSGEPEISDEEKRLALQGNEFFQGDIILPDEHMLENGLPGEQYRWYGYPGKGDIPIIFHISVKPLIPTILRAFAHYHENTCIRFVPYTDQKDYIKITSGKGCYSYLGRRGGEQLLSLGRGCQDIGTILHELGHAIGFYHEHNRSDRDDYVDIYRENVMKGKEHNFDKLEPSQNILITPFDYNSIMIYGNYAFSSNKKMTMQAKNGQKLTDPYEKYSLDPSDISRIKELYKCK